MYNNSFTDIDKLYAKAKREYFKILNIFQNIVPDILTRLAGSVIKNPKLKNAATRIGTPQPFKPFIELIEQSTGISFPTDLIFTKEEVVKSDTETIRVFSVTNYDTSSLNFSLLLKAAIQSFEDLGILSYKGQVTMPIELSADSFPKSTSSGDPLFKPKSNPEARQDAIEFGERFINQPSYNALLKSPTAVFHRYQYKFKSITDQLAKKIRAIWGISFRVGVVEGYFFRNIVNHVRDFQFRLEFPYMATGLRGVQVSERIIKSFRSRCMQIYSVDVESFDANVPTFMWILFYAIYISVFSFTPIQIKALTSLAVFHNFTPFVYMDTKLQFQRKGIPSGSLITQLFGSFVSRTILNYAFLEKTGKPAFNGGTVLGDDNLVNGDYFTLDYLISVYKRFGLTINKSKCSVSRYNEPIQFLGRIWDIKNRPTAPQEWYMAHLALPSKFYTNLPFSVAEFQTYRALSIVAPLYNGLQMFEKLVGWGDFVYQNLLKEFAKDPSRTNFRLVSNIESEFLKSVNFSAIKYGGWKRF